MWTPLYTGHFGLVPKVSAFRGSTVIDLLYDLHTALLPVHARGTSLWLFQNSQTNTNRKQQKTHPGMPAPCFFLILVAIHLSGPYLNENFLSS